MALRGGEPFRTTADSSILFPTRLIPASTGGLRSLPVRPHCARPILAWLCVLCLLLSGLSRAPGLVLCIASGGHVAIDIVPPGERCAGGCRTGVPNGVKAGGQSDLPGGTLADGHDHDAPALAGDCCVDVPIHSSVTAIARATHAAECLAPPILTAAWCLADPGPTCRTFGVPPPSDPPDSRSPCDLLRTVVLIL